MINDCANTLCSEIFRKLLRAFNCFVVFLQIALIWLLKERRLSIFSPKRSTWVSLSIKFSFTLIGILSVRLQFFDKRIAWNFDGLAIILFWSIQSFATSQRYCKFSTSSPMLSAWSDSVLSSAKLWRFPIHKEKNRWWIYWTELGLRWILVVHQE